MVAYSGPPPEPPGNLDDLIKAVIAEKGSLESTHAVFLFEARQEERASRPQPPAVSSGGRLPIYPLAKDYGAYLKAHAVTKRLRPQFPDADYDGFLTAVEYNLDHAPSFEEWSFA
jgi:hypothetical protein